MDRHSLPRKPRVVIVGAGMAGLSAACRLHTASQRTDGDAASGEGRCGDNCSFDLRVLEGSNRIGGRICTTSLPSNIDAGIAHQVELGATWIHGIQGSPLYEIAQRADALRGEDGASWERHDLESTEAAAGTLFVEGGGAIDASVVQPVVQVFNEVMDEVKGRGEHMNCKKHFVGGSVGSYARQALEQFLQKGSISTREVEGVPKWDLHLLYKSVFAMLEDAERISTASNSLHDLDLDSEKEYEEFPGDHVTIGKGYTSIVNELARVLPHGTIELNKKVSKVYWNYSYKNSLGAGYGDDNEDGPVIIVCEDGSTVHADHVILTMSLGVLKASTATAPGVVNCNDVWRSVNESCHRASHKCELFEPALPQWKLQSISRLGFGLVDKLFLLVDPSASHRIRSFMQFIYRQGEEAASLSNLPWWMRKTFSICPIYKGADVLLCWFAGAEALEMERLSDEEVVDGVVETLASFGLATTCADDITQPLIRRETTSDIAQRSLPLIQREATHDIAESLPPPMRREATEEEKQSLRKAFCGVLRSRWASNPMCQGSYSYVAVGASGFDIDALAEPLPKSSIVTQKPTLVSSPSSVSVSSSCSSLSPSSSSAASSSSSFDFYGEDEEEEEYGSVVSDEGDGSVVGMPSLQLLFAGEATHRHFYSSTHGAFLSGAREADRLLNQYCNLLKLRESSTTIAT